MGQLSQSKLALQSEISVGYINRMVRGTVPSRDIIVRLAGALETDPGALLAAAGYTEDDPDGDLVSRDPRSTGRDSRHAPGDVLGSEAAAQYYRQCWDRYVKPIFKDAEIPSGAGFPLSKSGIRARVMRILAEIVEDVERD